MKHLPIALLLAASANVASAQCLISNVSTASIGPSCNLPSPGFCLIVPPPTELQPVLDTLTCTLTVHVQAFEGCGASIPLRALALGVQNAAIPLPEFGLGCTLHLIPVALLAQTSGPFVLQLPPTLSSFGLLAQGAALSQAPFGSSSMTFSAGLAINLQ